jgi:fused signal recognition particle receptor
MRYCRRLHNKKNLKEELKKISRIIEREFPEAYKEIFSYLMPLPDRMQFPSKAFQRGSGHKRIGAYKADGTAKAE